MTSRFLKNVQSGYPLKLVVEKVEEIDTEFNAEFLQKMLKKIDYDALREAALVCGHTLPEKIPDNNSINQDEDLKSIHRALFNIEIIEGELICPESKRKFRITDGIPNFLVEDE